MGLHILDWTVLAGYFVFVTMLGWWARRLIKTQGDFLMGGRRFGGAMLSFLGFGSGTHTDQAVIVASQAYTLGFSGIWVQMLWLFVTPFYWLMAPIYRRARCYTCSDIYERRFGQSMAVAYTLMGVLIQALVIGMMLKATGKLVTGMAGDSVMSAKIIPLLGPFKLTVTFEGIIIAVMTVLFLTYGVMGGLIAAVWTDVLQGILTIVLSFLMVPFALAKLGGFAGFHTQMPNHDQIFRLISENGVGVFAILMLVINGIINNAGQAGTIMGFAAGRTEVEGRVGKVYGNMLKRFCIVGWALVGVAAIILYPQMEPMQVFGHAVQDLLPFGLVGLMLAAALAAMMSTCDVSMVTAAGLLTENIWKRYIRPGASERHYVTVNRIASVFIVIIALFFARVPLMKALTAFLWTWPTFMGLVFWLGIFMKRANAYGAWAAFLGSAGVWAYLSLYKNWGAGYLTDPTLPRLYLLYIVLGTLAGIVVSLLTPRPDQKQINDFYLTISTPVGEEDKLEQAGVEFLYK